MRIKYIDIEPIGQVAFIINERSKRIRLSVKSDGDVVVSMPCLALSKDALRFVESKVGWILKKKSKIGNQSSVFSPESIFRTRLHQLVITLGNTDKICNRIGNGIVQIFVPDHVDFYALEIQEFIKKTLTDVMRLEAKAYLPMRLKELADKHGFKYNQISIKNASTRWGSCSSVNNINLNLHLMRVPEQLIDYVIIHELVHTVVKNHSEKFWLLLEQCYPNCRIADKEMRNYRTQTF
jgi:predicted metal-dependent hydrolase